MTPQIGVIGPGDGADESLVRIAESVGAALATRGCIVVTGGLGGVMQAASRGAANAGAPVVALLPGDDPKAANPHATIRIATCAGQGRNVALVHSVDAVIAVGRGYGTLSEIAFALRAGRPVVALESWNDIDPAIRIATDAEEAVRTAIETCGVNARKQTDGSFCVEAAYEPRPIRPREALAHEGWRLKVYDITCPGESLDAPAFAAAIPTALDALPVPAVTASRPGLGFVIRNQGAAWVYIVLGWWDCENELPLRIWSRPRRNGGVWGPARASQSICVWDAQVVDFERNAYVEHVLARAHQPDLDAYLNARIEVTP